MTRFRVPSLPSVPTFTPSQLRKFNGWATVLWLVLVIPSLLLWKKSVPWLVFMSVWANVAGHFSAWQAARVEANQEIADQKTKESRDG